MNTHEYQAKAILKKYGVSTPEFFVLEKLQDLDSLALPLPLVLKVQVHAGGRGKAGGVKMAHTKEELYQHAQELLGKKIVNEQTGPEGIVSQRLLITTAVSIASEAYVGLLINRETKQILLLLSPVGGMDIETIARTQPDKLLKIALPQNGRLRSYQHIRIAKFMGWSGDVAKQGKKILDGLARAFIECDASLLEINPLAQTATGELIALDAKLSIDDNALFRHPEIQEWFDPTQVSPNEALAHELDLAYVALDGNIGCMVNGAGLAMATMDLIKHYGGKPANFLDVGGSATEEKIAEGFRLLLSDTHIKAILVNIFGGIMNCETLAKGIVEATKDSTVHLPIIVRMEGTNVEKGFDLLKNSSLCISIAKDLADAARMVAQQVGGICQS